MAVTFSGATVSALAADIIQSAGYEIGVFAPGESIPAADALWGLEKLQRIIDSWNASRPIIFSSGFDLYTVPANVGPTTIGPTGTLNTGPAAFYRPARITSASFVLNPGSSSPVDLPINIRTKEWWAANPLKSMLSSIVTDLYYDPAQPNGNLNFFPISNVNCSIRLEMWNQLQQALILTTKLGFVQGYWEALVSTLAIALCPSYERQPSPVLVSMQQKAMQTILANNDPPPVIRTDSGMPGTASDGRPDFNFLSGLRE